VDCFLFTKEVRMSTFLEHSFKIFFFEMLALGSAYVSILKKSLVFLLSGNQNLIFNSYV
jgi:hypothetical protein